MKLKSLNKITFFSFIIFCFQKMSAQDTSLYNPQKFYSVNQIRQDFEIFKKALEEAHPGLYWHVSKEKVDKKFTETAKSLRHNIAEIEFYNIITSLVSYIKDAHTFAVPPDDLMNYFKTTAKIFPLKVYDANNKLYVLSSPNNVIAKGSEILAINKKPTSAIVSEIFSHIPADGDMLTGKKWLMNGWFSFYYYIFIEQAENFSITYTEPGSIMNKDVFISAVSENKDSLINRSDIPKNPLYSFAFIDDSIPLLTIKAFANNEGGDYSKFLDSLFNVIKNKKSNNLIIDLRGNDGGRDRYGSLLYSYLTTKDFKYYEDLFTTTDSITFLQYTNRDSSLNQEIKECVDKVGSHLFKLRDTCHPNLSLQKPQSNPFLGNVYILINGGSLSTTCEFCTAVHTNSRGKFVGEETGGNYFGNCSGEELALTLPNTKIKVYIPLYKYVLAVSDNANKNRGIRPDYSLTPSIQDVINENDSILQYTLKLIKENKNK